MDSGVSEVLTVKSPHHIVVTVIMKYWTEQGRIQTMNLERANSGGRQRGPGVEAR